MLYPCEFCPFRTSSCFHRFPFASLSWYHVILWVFLLLLHIQVCGLPHRVWKVLFSKCFGWVKYVNEPVLLGWVPDSMQIHYCEWANDVIFINQKCDITIVIVTVLFPGSLSWWFAQHFHFCLLLGTEQGHASQTLGWGWVIWLVDQSVWSLWLVPTRASQIGNEWCGTWGKSIVIADMRFSGVPLSLLHGDWQLSVDQ